MKKHKLIWWVVIAVQLLLAGCVIVPIPTGERVLEGTPVTEDQLQFIRSGETTRDEIIRRLGEPNVVWENVRLYDYRWTTSNWGIAYFSEKEMGFDDMINTRSLLIHFDEQDKVSRFQLVEFPQSMYGACVKNWLDPQKTPLEEESSKSAEGNKSLVALRFVWDVGGERYEPDRPIEFSVGGFETGGVYIRPSISRLNVTPKYFFSLETRKQGWTYIFLEPGIYYLSFRLPTWEHSPPIFRLRTRENLAENNPKNWPRWRFDIAEGGGPHYIGSFYLESKGRINSFWENITRSKLAGVHIQDEKDLAEKILMEFDPNSGPLHRSLMKKFEGGPLYLRVPSRKAAGSE